METNKNEIRAKKFINQLVSEMPIKQSSEMNILNTFKLIISQLQNGKIKKTIQSDLETYYNLFSSLISAKTEQSTDEPIPSDSNTIDKSALHTSHISYESIAINSSTLYNAKHIHSHNIKYIRNYAINNEYESILKSLLHMNSTDYSSDHLLTSVAPLLTMIKHDLTLTIEPKVDIQYYAAILAYITVINYYISPSYDTHITNTIEASTSLLTMKDGTLILYYIGMIGCWVQDFYHHGLITSASDHSSFLMHLQVLSTHLKYTMSDINTSINEYNATTLFIHILSAYYSLFVLLNIPTKTPICKHIQHALKAINTVIIMTQNSDQSALNTPQPTLWHDILYPTLHDSELYAYNPSKTLPLTAPDDSSVLTKPLFQWLTGSALYSHVIFEVCNQYLKREALASFKHATYGDEVVNEGVDGGKVGEGYDGEEEEEEEEVEVDFVLDSYGDNEPSLLAIPPPTPAASSAVADEQDVVDSLIQELSTEAVVNTMQTATKTPGKRGRPTKASLAIDSIPPSDVTDTHITVSKSKRSRAASTATTVAATVTEEEEDQNAKDEHALGTAPPLPITIRPKKAAKTPTITSAVPVTEALVEEGEGDSVSGTESETESVKALKRSQRMTKKPDKYLA